MKKLLIILLLATLSGYGQIMPGVLSQAKTVATVAPTELPLILTWDDIANVPVADASSVSDWNTFFGLVDCPENSDAPAPSNITITPDAVGDNPVTWYYTVCYMDGVSERSLFSTESSFTIGDATTEITYNSDPLPSWAITAYIALGIVSETYTHITVEFTLPEDITDCFETGHCYSDIELWDIHQDCTTNGTPFTSVVVNGNDIELYGGSGITLRATLFTDDANLGAMKDALVSIVDEASCVDSLESVNDSSPFYSYDLDISCDGLTTVELPIITIGGNYCFYGCSSLVNLTLNAIEIIGQSFISETIIENIDLPSLISCGNSCFGNLPSLTTVSIPLCTSLGTTTGDDAVFDGITGLTIAVTCDASLLSAQGPGVPDGDLCYLHANNIITVNGAPLTGCP